ncbi:MAG: hypothetical protein GWN87_10090 [Desulfuromonadales bacterium]|nr:hypothetical protein [Desulfuromonadales bacterium]
MLVDVEMHKKVVSMAGAIFTNETAHEFFVKNPGANELSFAWLDPATELMCKGRADRIGQIGEWPVVGDLKTARDASRREIEKAIEKFGYHIQAAHYLDGLQTIHPVPEGNPFRRYMLFVIESEPPYLCASYEIDDIALEEGLSQRRQYMNQYAECVETGYWPGYPAGVEYVSLPAWHFKIYREG